MRMLERFEHAIVAVLLVLLALVVALATVELAWVLLQDLLMPPRFLLEIPQLLDLFSQFLLVLIGIELLHLVRTSLQGAEAHLEMVFVVALIAVTRKIVVLAPAGVPGGTLGGLAALVFALAVGYLALRRVHRARTDTRR